MRDDDLIRGIEQGLGGDVELEIGRLEIEIPSEEADALLRDPEGLGRRIGEDLRSRLDDGLRGDAS